MTDQEQEARDRAFRGKTVAETYRNRALEMAQQYRGTLTETVEAFVTKDSGQRQTFGTRSHRDLPTGKLRFDLLPWYVLERWAGLMARGADKYGENNWRRGQPLSRYHQSALRHLHQWFKGETDEDHLAAVLFNIGGLMYTEAAIAAGNLPEELNDKLGLLEGPKDE